jgi:hypothetical protein
MMTVLFIFHFFTRFNNEFPPVFHKIPDLKLQIK